MVEMRLRLGKEEGTQQNILNMEEWRRVVSDPNEHVHPQSLDTIELLN